MSDQERETEEDEGGGTLDTAPMLPQRPPDHHTSALRSSGWSGLAIRGLKTLLLPGRALAVLLLHLLLPGTVFLLLLLPTAGIVYLGFLCHSRSFPDPSWPGLGFSTCAVGYDVVWEWRHMMGEGEVVLAGDNRAGVQGLLPTQGRAMGGGGRWGQENETLPGPQQLCPPQLSPGAAQAPPPVTPFAWPRPVLAPLPPAPPPGPAPPDPPRGGPQVHPAPGPRCRALLSDRGSAALIVLGFLSLPPLLVLASAARARLIRHLRLLLPSPAGNPGSHEEQFCAWA
ncbi:Hypothetical predicted protein [Marmota monax]|uniref:Transmembrane protein 88B n=1 Tax=Marmota monax TaxID=9995 RepID=A0A5E4BDQ0_MARMO|nr:hypothetical protein GHT09_006988 [Marmota monax]VTJ67009.1 Hypothetical predicted protein [Marmota monax]